MSTLIEKLNTGILEEKGIFKDLFEPTHDELMWAYFEVTFIKEYLAPNGLNVFHVKICGQESVSVLKEGKVINRVTNEDSVKKQVDLLSKIQFVRSLGMKEILNH